MKTLVHFIKRFYAGLLLGSGVGNKIKAAFGLVFISKLSELRFVMKSFGKRAPVILRTGSDAAMWLEVFFDHEYSLVGDYEPRTILDLGANAGFTSLYFTMRYPNTSIVSVEPDPFNIELLKKNLSSYGNVKIIEAAAAAKSGTVTFHMAPNQGMSSSLTARENTRAIQVSAYSFDSLLNQLGWQTVDLVKFDIEGAEYDVFKMAPLSRANTFIGEYHQDLTGKTIEEFTQLFASHMVEIKKSVSGTRAILVFKKST